MLTALCLCQVIPRIDTLTRLVVLIHKRETYRTTNTGRLATLALSNSELRVRGLLGETLQPKGLVDEDRQSLLLYPCDESLELTQEFLLGFKRPFTLIVPDGNWRQASKMGRREPLLSKIPWVKLPKGKPSEYLLRKEQKKEGLATIEAIAKAMGILEGPSVEAKLYSLFKTMVERTLGSRPKLEIKNEI